jgi:predicted metalloenzyme YecM
MMMQKLKQRSEELCNRLNGDISRIKQQKVALQKHMETSAKQFAAWRVDREKVGAYLARCLVNVSLTF